MLKILLVLLLTQSAFADREVTNQETKVYKYRGGAVMATIGVGTPTECGITNSHGYCKIQLSLDVTPDQAKLMKIRAGETLLIQEKEVGKANADLPITSMSGDSIGIIRNLIVKASDLDPLSVAERAFVDILKRRKTQATSGVLFDYLDSFGFKKDETLFKPYFSYGINENLGDGIDPKERLVLIFDEKDKLIAVIGDGRPIHLTAVKEVRLKDGYRLYWLESPAHTEDTDRVADQFDTRPAPEK